MMAAARDSLPELPEARRERFAGMGLDPAQASQLASDAELGDYFEAVVAAGGSEARVVANWVVGDLAAVLREEGIGERPEAAELARLVDAAESKAVTHAVAKTILGAVLRGEGSAEELVGRETEAAGSVDLESVVDAAITAEPEAAEQVREGNMKAIGRLVGFVMKETQGRADGGEVTRLIRQKLGLG